MWREDTCHFLGRRQLSVCCDFFQLPGLQAYGPCWNKNKTNKKITTLRDHTATLSNIKRTGMWPSFVVWQYLIASSECAVARRNTWMHVSFTFFTWKPTYRCFRVTIQVSVFFILLIYNLIYLWPSCSIFFFLAWFAIFKILCTARICYDKRMCLNMKLFLVAHLFLCSSVWSCQA